MPGVSATLRHLSAQRLDAGVVREALLQTSGSGGRPQRTVSPAVEMSPTGAGTAAAEKEAGLLAEPKPFRSPANKSVSFSDIQQLRNSTPDFVGTRSSRYDIRARRRAAERGQERSAEQPAPTDVVGDQRASVVAGPKDWWKRQQWLVGNDRQASQQAWRIERRESRLRPLASQPPFGKSAAAFSLDPVFDTQTRGRINTLSHELETSESFAATLITDSVRRKPRRNSKPRKLQLAATKSLPDLSATGNGLRFIEAVNAIRSGLGLGAILTPQEVVRQGCVELGVEWRPQAATLKHSTWLLCEELGIMTGWDETQLRTMRASEVHPSWSGAPIPTPHDNGSTASLSSASSNDSEHLQQLRDQARIAVGSYAKAATAKMKKQAAIERSMSHGEATDTQLGRKASVADIIEEAPQQKHTHGQQQHRDRGPLRRSDSVQGSEAAGANPEWIDGLSQALDRAAAGDGRPIFVTTRPQALKGKSEPKPGAGESFAFRPSFILPQTRVLIKQPSVVDEDEPFSPPPR